MVAPAESRYNARVRPLICSTTLLLNLWLISACGGTETPPPECTLPNEPLFDVTEVKVDEAKSNDDCPDIAAADLDTQALQQQGLCEQKVDDCIIVLTCDYEGLTIRGRLAERDGALVGRFDIEQPITCVYSVKGEWQDDDGGS